MTPRQLPPRTVRIGHVRYDRVSLVAEIGRVLYLAVPVAVVETLAQTGETADMTAKYLDALEYEKAEWIARIDPLESVARDVATF